MTYLTKRKSFGGLRKTNLGLILISMSMKFLVKTDERMTKTNQTRTVKRESSWNGRRCSHTSFEIEPFTETNPGLVAILDEDAKETDFFTQMFPNEILEILARARTTTLNRR